MPHAFKALLAPLFILLLSVAALSSCGSKPVEEEKADPAASPLKITIPHIEQYTKLGRKSADGQYLVVKVNVKNDSVKQETLDVDQLLLGNITDKEEEKYTQKAEQFLSGAFSQEYGFENREKLIEAGKVPLNPRIEMERYIIYMVPKRADLNKFELTYKPYNLRVPLVSEVTVLDDRRKFDD